MTDNAVRQISQRSRFKFVKLNESVTPSPCIQKMLTSILPIEPSMLEFTTDSCLTHKAYRI